MIIKTAQSPSAGSLLCSLLYVDNSMCDIQNLKPSLWNTKNLPGKYFSFSFTPCSLESMPCRGAAMLFCDLFDSINIVRRKSFCSCRMKRRSIWGCTCLRAFIAKLSRTDTAAIDGNIRNYWCRHSPRQNTTAPIWLNISICFFFSFYCPR